MRPHPAVIDRVLPSEKLMKQVIGGLSVFTLLMTIPQILAIWVSHQAAGVSLLSWSAYWISAFVWFGYGIQKRDRNIYLPCIGWLLLDGSVIVGTVIYG
jgi:uncharacterized protein with PQ loop repeat